MSVASVALVVLLATGCGSDYVLRGRVVKGFGGISQIAASQAPESGEGLPGAAVALYRDPGSPNMAKIASGVTDGEGNFTIPLDVFGAGWMEEAWLIEVVRRGYQTLDSVEPLPRAKDDRWLLIGLDPGESISPARSEGLWDEFLRHK